MRYETLNNEINNISFDKKYFVSIFGLYFFTLGTILLGYSTYLLLEGVGIVQSTITTWNGQSLFWFLIIFFIAIFILFIPVEFFGIFKIFNNTFKDLIMNILAVILISLLTLVVFQFLINPSNLVVSNLILIGRATSFAGFIAIPLLLFLQHNLKRTIDISENLSYSIVILFWILTSNIFL